MVSSALILAAAFASPPPAQPEFMHYKGLCEASAAVILDRDHFAVASDEADKLKDMEDQVLIYRRGVAEHVGQVKVADVRDLEAAAATARGDRIYWLTSHSLKKDGEDNEKRRQLIAASVNGPTFTPDRHRYGGLRRHIADMLGTGEWPLDASLNVEGMAVTEQGDLLLGLRAPLKKDGEKYKAAVVRIRDAARLTSGSPSSDRPEPEPAVWWLDLGGRGIRSLERARTGAQAYLIVAGATREGDDKPALYWWDGVSDTVTPGPEGSFSDPLPGENGEPPRDMVPEAAIVWGDGAIEIFGDNEFRKDGVGCSDESNRPGKRWFPSRLIRP